MSCCSDPLNSLPSAPDRLPDLRPLVSSWAVECGRRVAERRTAVGWSRSGLALVAGTTEATITRVEQGIINPRDYLKWAIATALHVEVSVLWPYPRRDDVYAAATDDA